MKIQKKHKHTSKIMMLDMTAILLLMIGYGLLSYKVKLWPFTKSQFNAATEEQKTAGQDIKKRSINKKVEFGGTTLLIPENTRINPKHGNIVDEKTGYGIAIMFKTETYCAKVFYRKKVRDDKYIVLYYNDKDKELDIIGQKIIRANGLTNTCK